MRSSLFLRLFNPHTGHPYLRAVVFMLIATTSFSLMNVGVRIISEELHATVIVTLRNALTIALILPLVVRHKFALLRTTRMRDHFSRGSLGAIGMITWTYCLGIMPINHATALSFTSPIFATLFAVLFLGETATAARWAALFVGFIGTLIILDPSAGDFHWNSLIVIFATTSWAITSILVKSLTRTEPPLRIVFYMNFFMFLWALPFGLAHWAWPSLHAWMILVLIACCSIVMHFSTAKAYSLAPVVTLLPLDFIRLIVTAILAYFLFGETSSLNTWVGAALIIAAAVVMARRDAKAAALVSEV